MSGIPIYTQSPINASKASGTTPQNAAPATTIASSSYPPAKPGAAAPAPTTAAQRYAPVQPTPTTKTDNNGPPAPQPGAVPSPLGMTSIPPPPKAGESYQPAQRTAAFIPSSMPKPYPPQMFIPPPATAFGAQPPASSTAATNVPSLAYPIPLQTEDYGAPRRSLEHPPGYLQNAYASELTSDQRRAEDANKSSGLGGYDNSEKESGMGAESVWNAAKQWVSAAGDKISETEAEIWRRINKE